MLDLPAATTYKLIVNKTTSYLENTRNYAV